MLDSFLEKRKNDLKVEFLTRIITCYDWKLAAFSKVPETLLSGVDERPDDLQVALLVLVRRLHGPQPAVVEDRHEEALRQVVQVLAKSEHVVAFTTCSSVNSTTLHSRAEGTDRRTIALQCLQKKVFLPSNRVIQYMYIT